MEVPISSITNGVHLPSWLNEDLALLYDQYLEPDWRERFNDPSVWRQVHDMPDEELLEVRNFGETTLKEVKQKLEERGMHLGMKLPTSLRR